MKIHSLAACVLVLASGCKSDPKPTKEEVLADALRPKNEYARAESSNDLIVLFVRDADAGKWPTVVQGLDAFMRQCVQTEHEAWGNAMFEELKPVWRMQKGGGYKYVTAVQNMADVLRISAQRAVTTDRAAWNRGDRNPIRAANADERSYIAVDIRKHLPDPLAAEFLDAMFVAQELQNQNGIDQLQATNVAQRCERVASSLDKAGRADDSLLLRIAGAQTLDAAKLDDAALDRWLEVSSAPALAHADAVLQVAVARRIQSFHDRLRDELATSIRKEEEARADSLVASAKEETARLTEEQRTKIAGLEHDMAELSTRSKIEKEDAVKAEREMSAETIAHHKQRITELEKHLVDIATMRAQNPTQIDWNTVNFGQGPSSNPADVIGQWQKSQANTPPPPASAEGSKPTAPPEAAKK